MIPKITRGGSSFKGAFQYYMHDKGASTQDRVEWAHTENMFTDDAEKAWKIMAFTAKEQDRLKEASGQSRAGRKLEKPVFAFSLAWHPEQDPDKEHMLDTARKAINMLGLSEHEAVIVAHRDEPQKHVHVIVNRVHPLTGLAGDVRNSKLKFSDFAREYEREHGKIYCQQREENHQKREQGETTRYRDPAMAEAWDKAVSGMDFVTRLEKEGYLLAQGRKRVVVIDPHGKAHNPTRLLGGIKAKEFRERLNDVDLTRLPDAESLTQQTKKADPDLEKKRATFEKLASMQLNTLQDSHANEESRIRLQYDRRFNSAKKRLARHYGLPEQKRAITELANRTKHATWWKRLLRIAHREREELRSLTLAYKNAHWRYREQLSGIKKQRDDAVRQLQARQKRESEELKRHLGNQRKSLNFAITGNYQSRSPSKEKPAPDQTLTYER